jgi:hypothetical protein
VRGDHAEASLRGGVHCCCSAVQRCGDTLRQSPSIALEAGKVGAETDVKDGRQVWLWI